ncbi:MAG: 50S ribosomal protein L21 [Hydrotalea sp.]|nr:50S ribosomal protein L21 [Hydrotalea sp.]
MTDYAIIKTGGKQYRVEKGDILRVEKLPNKKGDKVDFPVLMMGGAKPAIGNPLVAGAKVSAEIMEQGHLPTIRIFKKKRRHNYRRNNGVRPLVSLVRITNIG